MKFKRTLPKAMASIALALSATLAPHALAQSDNFDSGTLDAAWKAANFNPALVNLSFPAVGSGKGLRIRANPVPGAAPAVGILYREDVYSDFYVGVDIVDWPGTDKNQAIVLLARAVITGNPAQATGIICNYDASQYGEGATSRRQGQFQINMVAPGFATKTLAVTEITLQPGRSYRMSIQGVGSHYTAKLYDYNDLAKPLVTLEADDVDQGPPQFETPFTSGKCGILSFSREGTAGTSDVTLDNYYAGPTDPNVATAPALAHQVPGTPTIESHTPGRFQNFVNPANPITFTAKTYTADVINAAATKLTLNGVDVSSQLVLPANGSTITASLPGGVLKPNTVYTAQIDVADTTGAKKSTTTLYFDTFSDAFLKSAAVKTIEAEDFNRDAGNHIAEPIPVSGYDSAGNPVNPETGYLEALAEEGIDFHDLRAGPESPWGGEYRSSTPVGLSAGLYPEILDLNETAAVPIRRGDNVRSQFAAADLLETVVHRTQVGEWLNYTRSFTAGSYTPYLRVASFGATTIELSKVTSDITQPDQTTAKLGSFRVPNLIQRFNYTYVPLVDDAGAPVKVNLSGTETLRLTMAGTASQDERKVAINYLMLANIVEDVQLSVSAQTASTVTLSWTGGSGKFLVQKKAELNAANWINVLTTTDHSATVLKDGGAGFFRVQSDYTGADVMPLTAFLSGDAEKPTAVTTAASGLATLSLQGTTLNYLVTYSGFSATPTAAHIHGSATVDSTTTAGVMVGFPTPANTTGYISGSATLTEAQRDNVLAGRSYVNIHTAANGGGEIRGNVLRTQYTTVMNGANERPTPVVTDATGAATVSIYGNELRYNVSWTGLSGSATAGHIHGRADATTASGVLQGFTGVTGATGSTTGTVVASQALLGAILDGKTYVNIHTAANGGGEIRGQLAP